MNREEKIQILALLQEKQRRARACPLSGPNFEMSIPQRMATDAIKSHRIVIFGGGNRAGKSTWTAAMTLCYIYGYFIFDVPDLELTPEGDYPPRHLVPQEYWTHRVDEVPTSCPSTILMLTGLPFQRGIGSVMWPKIESLFPPGTRRSPNFHVQRGQASTPVQFTHPNGTKIIFGSGQQDAFSFEGVDFDVVIVDEPIPRSFWAPIWRGLTDRYGSLIASMTPVGGNAPWIHDSILPREDCMFLTGSIWSNKFIPDKAKREFLDGLECSEEEKEARETGAFSVTSQRAFPTFDRSVHIVPKRPIRDAWKIICSCDPAHRRPYFIVWIAVGPQGDYEIFNEWPRGVNYMDIRSSTDTITEYATIIRNTEATRPANLRVLDPRFGKAHHRVKGYTTTSIQEDFLEYGLYFDVNVPNTEREETGINHMRNLLSWDKHAPISELNRPKLVVQEQCTNCIAALEKSLFVPPSARDPMLLGEDLTEHWKDARDAIRYAVLTPVMFGDPATLSYISEKELLMEDEYEV